MSQYLINASDLPSGTLPTTPVVIKDNDLAGMFNTSDYKYYSYGGIPELTYMQFDGNNNIVKSTDIIQTVENGYYPIIIVHSVAPVKTKTSNDGEYPSNQLGPGIWGFNYYFYDNGPMAMFTLLQSFSTSSSSQKLRGGVLTTATDYLGTFYAPVVDSDGYWHYTTNLFSTSYK